MKLYYSETSPYVRKARVAIRELDLAARVEEILVKPFESPPELVAVNPLSKIPVLITDQYEALSGSELIMKYLDAQGSAAVLYPDRGTETWTYLNAIGLVDGTIDAAVAQVLESRRPEGLSSPEQMQRQQEKIEATVEMLEAMGPTPDAKAVSAYEITLGCALAYFDFRLPDFDWHPRAPLLFEWYQKFAARSPMQTTQAPPMRSV